MQKYLLCILSILIMGSGCSSEETLPTPQNSPYYLSGYLNGRFWRGEVFDTYLNDVGELIVNAQVQSQKTGVTVEQITLHIPEFSGLGTYELRNPGGMYREWCCFDHLVTGVWTHPAVGDSGVVVIESFDTESGEIGGKVEFTASRDGQAALSFNGGEFFSKLKE